MLRFILNINGYGKSVISKLKETKVKRNLYYEMKEKIVEEELNEGKLVRRKKIVKVFGLDSSQRIRNDVLIELLKERVSLHKDKFISPTLHKEMSGLIVKKNGNIDHSDLTHDDQIFSYLLALYVWYEGKNIRETWGIEKSGIKTDEDIDDVIELDTSPNKNSTDISKDLNLVNAEFNPEMLKLQYSMGEIIKAKGVLYKEYKKMIEKQESEYLAELLQDPIAKEAYARNYGVDPNAINPNTLYNESDNTNPNMRRLPNHIFLDDSSEEDKEDRIYNINNILR